MLKHNQLSIKISFVIVCSPIRFVACLFTPFLMISFLWGLSLPTVVRNDRRKKISKQKRESSSPVEYVWTTIRQLILKQKSLRWLLLWNPMLKLVSFDVFSITLMTQKTKADEIYWFYVIFILGSRRVCWNADFYLQIN